MGKVLRVIFENRICQLLELHFHLLLVFFKQFQLFCSYSLFILKHRLELFDVTGSFSKLPLKLIVLACLLDKPIDPLFVNSVLTIQSN